MIRGFAVLLLCQLVGEVVSRASRRGPDRDELRFVSLDLVDSPTARVKVYTFHHAASVGDLEHVMGLAQYSDPELLRALPLLRG